MKILVIGGNAAGLAAALLLARDGHRVTVLEHDDLRPAPDVETAAATAFRASAPQVVQPHVGTATFRLLLRQWLPDVYAALLDAGALEADLSTQMPPTMADRAPAPGDEDLAFLMTRRATVDWVLTRTACDEPGVEIRYGVRVVGLLAERGDPPRARGVRTARGEDVPADLVVDASGRRSAVDQWLGALGAGPSATSSAECGAAYFSRQYRVRDVPLPAPRTTRLVLALEEFTVGIWAGDNDTMQIALAPLAVDRRFVAARRPEVFTAAVRTVPYYAAWLDVLEPITEVSIMGGLHNTLRRLVVDGAPVVLGLHGVGDSVCTTNPTFGRGLGVVMRTVVDLVHVLGEHPDDLAAAALEMDRLIGRHVEPWYLDQAATDAARLDQLRHAVLGLPLPDRPPREDRMTFGELRLAAQVDPVAFRSLWKVFGMLVPPPEVYEEPELIARVRRILAAHPPTPPVGPTHEELEASLSSGAPLGPVGLVGSAPVQGGVDDPVAGVGVRRG